MIESLHFHRGYSLRLRKSKPLISYGIISQHQPRLLNPWSNAARPDVFPDGPKHHAFVHKVLDLVQERFALAAISLAVLLFEERVDVRIAPIGHGAATQDSFL